MLSYVHFISRRTCLFLLIFTFRRIVSISWPIVYTRTSSRTALASSCFNKVNNFIISKYRFIREEIKQVIVTRTEEVLEINNLLQYLAFRHNIIILSHSLNIDESMLWDKKHFKRGFFVMLPILGFICSEFLKLCVIGHEKLVPKPLCRFSKY